jgi:hypothetical protein
MDQPLREVGGLKSPPYYLVFIEFFGPKKFNVFKVLAFVVFWRKRTYTLNVKQTVQSALQMQLILNWCA